MFPASPESKRSSRKAHCLRPNRWTVTNCAFAPAELFPSGQINKKETRQRKSSVHRISANDRPGVIFVGVRNQHGSGSITHSTRFTLQVQ
jgi:hypothetical protein